eukprot:TRINITY_DN333_c0_g1_i2.p1 TRINITY_DN333_c0_g1~~TRINITY_DN333_c0_g1_i2.p1  ORF type:complete len:101 (-),score=41.94 TRINITY_DN333_c0_g1_i2:98-400(-)
MIRRPPRSTQSRSSAASDVYKRQPFKRKPEADISLLNASSPHSGHFVNGASLILRNASQRCLHASHWYSSVSYTHLRAHETVLDLVCRLLLEKKKKKHRT